MEEELNELRDFGDDIKMLRKLFAKVVKSEYAKIKEPMHRFKMGVLINKYKSEGALPEDFEVD